MKPSTSDPELLSDTLSNIMVAIERIKRRFEDIKSAEDFLSSNDGVDRLDGITMMLIAIGEQTKRLDHLLDIDLEDEYPEVDWKGVKGIRDFLSHHYFILDAEVIFDVCQNKIDGLDDAIRSIAAALFGDAQSPAH